MRPNGMWLSLVERAVWGRQVAGSNPVIPTKESRLMREDSKSKASRLGMAGETAATGCRSMADGESWILVTEVRFLPPGREGMSAFVRNRADYGGEDGLDHQHFWVL